MNGPQVIPPAYGLLGDQPHHRDRRRRQHRVLEPLRRGHADGRARHVHGAAHRRQRDQRDRRSGVVQAAGAAGVPAEHRRAGAARGQLRRRPRPIAARWCSKGAGKCATCHSGPAFTDANSKLHAPGEVVSEPEPNGAPSYASRSATKQYRTAPLRGRLAARAVLPQRQRRHARRRRRHLRHAQVAGPDRRPEEPTWSST